MLALFLAACGGAPDDDAGLRDAPSVVVEAGGICDGADSDGDGIPDEIEREHDTDGDGMPDLTDLDSDGDGVPDAEEAWMAGFGCPYRADCEGDGVPDALDTDSDDDGLTDAEEHEAGLDRCSADSDGDGCPDVVEVAFDGCADALVLHLEVFEERSEDVAMSVPAAAGPFAEVELFIEPGDARWEPVPADLVTEITASAATPPVAGTAVADSARFASVAGGAELGFSIRLQPTPTHARRTFVGWLVIRDDMGGEVTRRPLVVIVREAVILI